MPKCYKCNKDIGGVTDLQMHLRRFHKVDKYTDKFKCVESGCLVTYSTWEKLSRHYTLLHHFPKKSVMNVINCSNANLVDTSNVKGTVCDVEVSSEGAGVNTVCMSDPEELDVPSDDSLKSLLQMCGTKLVVKLYSKPGRPRCVVQEHISHTSEFLSSSLSVLSQIVKSKLENANVGPAVIEDISKSIEVVQNPFQGLLSDHLRRKFLQDHGYYIEPKDYTSAVDMFSKTNKRKVHWAHDRVKGKFVPLRAVFKRVFQLPDFLTVVLDCLQSPSPPGIISSFVHGPFWQTKKALFEGKIVIPLYLYFDDYEVDKDISPHSAKLGAIYVKIASLPAELQASVENIFLFSLFSAQDRVDYGNAAVFRKAISEINFLQETGIEVTSNNQTLRLYFTVGLVVADMQAMHIMLGFTVGFTANYPCRFCQVHRRVMYVQCKEDPTLLRDKIQHEMDCYENDVSSTGVNETSVLKEIRYFEPTENPSIDLLHDLWEGVAVYDMNQILYHLIIVKGYFTTTMLNVRIVNFHFGDSISNKPIQLSEKSIKKKTVKMTGNEMRSFVRTLSLLIGDLVVPDDPVWKFYVMLRDIVDILLCRHIQEEILDTLATLISDHHGLYIDLFHDNLKPKFHVMIHYPRIIKLSGCPINFSCDRFESKHQPSVQDAKATTSRRFTAHTLAVKDQLRLAYRLICDKGLQYEVDFGPEEFCSLNPSLFPANFTSCGLSQFSHVTITGTKYQSDTCVVLGSDEDGGPVFGLTTCILGNLNSEVLFLCNLLSTISYSEHYHSYLVKRTSVTEFVSPQNLFDYHPVLFCQGFDGKHYVTLHHAL